MFELLLDFFSEITSLQRGGLLAVGLMFFWIIEGFLPFRYLNYNKFKHASTNILLTLTTIFVNFSLAFMIVLTCDYISSSEIGFLSYFNIKTYPIWSLLISIMILVTQ